MHGLNHENIIKVKDFFKLKSGKFLSVMEYQEGYDLGKIVTDAETIMEENEKFANECYLTDNDQIYLKESFIINVVK